MFLSLPITPMKHVTLHGAHTTEAASFKYTLDLIA